MASLELYNYSKSKVLSVLAELAYKNEINEETPEVIARTLFPNLKDSVRRCCVYKEREITREQTRVALGKLPDGSTRTTGQLVYILDAACDGCDIHKVRITDSCRKCLAQSCERACRFDAIYMGNSKMHINYEKCKGCGMCIKACAYSAIAQYERPCRKACPTGALKHIGNEIAYINEEECINCGQCAANCPFGAISDVSYMTNVIENINEKKQVIALVAPAVQGQFAMAKLPQIFEAIKELGFTEVVEVSLGADLVTISEAEEALEHINNNKILTTSCCPAFVELIKKEYPEIYKEYTSTTVSPMIALARVIRDKYKDAVLTFVGPCIAKKHEISLKKNNGLIDYVLTFEEILAMMKAKGVDPIHCPGTLEMEHGSLAGRNYCYSGGVSSSLKVYLKEQNIDTSSFKVVAANGQYECKECLKKIKSNTFEGNILEGMMCLGGCTGGVASLIANPNVVKLNNSRENQAISETKISEVNGSLKIDNVPMHYQKDEN